MVKKLSGYILIGVGLLGFTYFESYKGNTIPLPTLWLILSIGIAVIGIYLTIIAKTKKQIQKLNETTSKLNRIKEKGERIFIDVELKDDDSEIASVRIVFGLESNKSKEIEFVYAGIPFLPVRSHWVTTFTVKKPLVSIKGVLRCRYEGQPERLLTVWPGV